MVAPRKNNKKKETKAVRSKKAPMPAAGAKRKVKKSSLISSERLPAAKSPGTGSEKRPSSRIVLGRGLDALLSDHDSSSQVVSLPKSSAPAAGISMLPVADIVLNPKQPRTSFDKDALRELTDSIDMHGMIQPITVRAFGKRGYQLVSGERRLQACKQLGLEKVPVYVREVENEQLLELALIENIQRESLNAIEIALSYQRLIEECMLSQEALAQRVAKERSTITNYLRLLRLPPDIQAALRDKRLSMGHARSLLSLSHPDAQLAMLKEIFSKGLSVRQTEARVRKEVNSSSNSSLLPSAASSKTPPPATHAMQNRLSKHLGTKVRFRTDKQGGGEIRITYFEKDDLDRIIDLLCAAV